MAVDGCAARRYDGDWRVNPGDLGLPPRFAAYRPGQLDAALTLATDERRFGVLCAGTGFGKTAAAATLAKLRNARTVVLTVSRNLQDQWAGEMGAAVVKGHANYRCKAVERGEALYGMARVGTNCAEAPCRVGVGCGLRRAGCLSYDARTLAAADPLAVTNYALWMALEQYGDGDTLGQRDLLVCDEAHNAEQWVCKAASTEITADDLALAGLSVPLALGDDQEAWREWAGEVVHIARDAYRAARDRALSGSGGSKAGARSPELVALAELGTKLRTLADPKFGAAGDTRWVVVATSDSVTLTPVWAHAFAEKLLWRGVGRVLLTSATITRNDARYLGFADDAYAFHEVASTFPPARHPFIYHPVAFIDYKLLRGQRGDDALQLVVNAFDNYMQPRLEAGRRGVVHTTSYEWTEVIAARSRLREKLIVARRDDKGRALRAYDASSDACALVSPAMKEGYDLADDRCRWALIVKVPSPDKRDAVFAARCADDAGYRAHVIARSLEQMHGRGMRHAGDWSETAIFDKHFGYLRNEAPFTAGFRKTWRYSERMPAMMEVAT